ncbi:MAG: hypothetical protein ACR5LF_02315 [Symbiopectobacterium sp.]
MQALLAMLSPIVTPATTPQSGEISSSNAKNSRATSNEAARIQAQVDDSSAMQDKSAVVAHTIADVTKQVSNGTQMPLTAYTTR